MQEAPALTHESAVLHPSAAPPTGTFYNTTFGYYGPIVFTVFGTNMTVGITLQGVATALKSGNFTLGPRMSAVVAYTGLPVPGFLVVGM